MQLSPQIIQLLSRGMFRTPGINPNEPAPGTMPQAGDPAQPQQSAQPRWMQGLNSPLGQIGMRMLAGSRDARGNPVGLGQAAGGAVLGYQQDQAGQAQADLQRQYMQAQIKKMGMPDPAAAPVVVTGPDGKPRYASREEAIGQQPYMEPAGGTQGPSEVEIARVLNDPNTPEPVKKDLLNLIQQKYRDTTEPLVSIQTPDGRTIYVPRSQAIGATPAATRENPSDGERSAANYLGRMEAAEQKLGNFKPSLMENYAAEKWLQGGSLTSAAANSMLDDKSGSFYQAAADWVRAKLRKESGAVISPEEMVQEIRTYFPQPGDSTSRIEQKRQARLQAQEGMKGMSGRATQGTTAPANPADPLGLRQ
jgi:hypothetical protein